MEKLSQPGRRLFLLGGVGSFTVLRGAPPRTQDPVCTLTSEQEEGPYYVDRAALRKDIAEQKPGLPLRLKITLVDAKNCAPLAGASLDIWHCDALGIYSGFTENGAGFFGHPPGPPPEMPPPRGGHQALDSTRFCRGVQIANPGGVVEFNTIYPGWYVSRDIHIHLKVHLGGHVCHTGQLFFPDDVSDSVAKLAPYNKHEDRRTRLEEDHVFTSESGRGGMVAWEHVDKSSLEAGLLASAMVAVDPEASPEPSFPGPFRRQ